MARGKSADGYVGKAALTIVRMPNGTQAYVYAGQKVPADAPDDEVTRLLKGGFIAEVKASAKPAGRQASTPPAPPASTPPGSTADGTGDAS